MEHSTSDRAKKRAQLRRLEWIITVWACILLILLLWHTYHYKGVIAVISEWQFRTFERMYPSLTVGLLVLFFSLPMLLLLQVRLHRYRRKYGSPPEALRRIRDRRVNRRVGYVAIFAALISIVAVIAVIIDRPPKFPEKTDLSFSEFERSNGLVDTTAWVGFDRLGYYEQRSLLSRTGQYLAPITKNSDSTTIEYFLLVNANEPKPAATMNISGYVRKSRLPGGFERLFNNEGYRVSRPTYVVYPNVQSAFKPYFGFAESVIRIALVLALGWLFHRMWIRRSRHKRGKYREV